MKFFAFFALALIAAVSADVSHLRQYLPPAAPEVAAPAPVYQPAPAPAPLPVAPAPVYQPAPAPIQAEPAAATFNEQDGYNYNTPF